MHVYVYVCVYVCVCCVCVCVCVCGWLAGVHPPSPLNAYMYTQPPRVLMTSGVLALASTYYGSTYTSISHLSRALMTSVLARLELSAISAVILMRAAL